MTGDQYNAPRLVGCAVDFITADKATLDAVVETEAFLQLRGGNAGLVRQLDYAATKRGLTLANGLLRSEGIGTVAG